MQQMQEPLHPDSSDAAEGMAYCMSMKMQLHELDAMPMQALALLQWRAGRMGEAREIFQEAVDNCKPHAPLWAAWASVEVRARAYADLCELTASPHYTRHKTFLGAGDLVRLM